MKYRAEAVGLIIDDRPVGFYSQSLASVNMWAHQIVKKHKCDVKIYESYERVLTIVRKPYEKNGSQNA